MANPTVIGEHGLTAEQFEACMKASDRWKKAALEEGWVLAHNALRLDMDEMAGALQALHGQALTKWQVPVLLLCSQNHFLFFLVAVMFSGSTG